jgi:choline dehydrogenase-like flavoprotein
MAPQSVGGVVDSSLKVYGTRNVRVVDASIFPMHIGHTQATVYSIAEKVSSHIVAACVTKLT